MNKENLVPAVEFATGQAVIKGEDLVLVRPRVSFPKSTGGARPVYGYGKDISDSASSVHVSANGLQNSLPLEEQGGRRSVSTRDIQGSLQGTGSFGLFCIFDGHNGVLAAEHLEQTLVQTLEERLPAGHPPAEGDEPAYTRWREELQRALVETFCELNEAFACQGQLAGTTITVVLQYGWLLTVANCGDSRALLDTGSELIQVTVDHRISTHQADRHRLEALGAQIAPIDFSGSGPARAAAGYGPLRVWPGGLCLSRGIGDFDIGPPVIACPHIYQVRVPNTGARLIVASDGVWDGFENAKRLSKLSRTATCQAAPNKVIQNLQKAYGGLRDDTSLVVLDIMPPGAEFSQLSAPKQQGSSGSGGGGGGCLCFAASPAVEPEADAPQQPLGKAQVLLNLDTAAAVGLMPEKLQQLPRWCNDDFCEAVRNSQTAACDAWNEARAMRSKGKKPSRQDLASYFSAVHHVRPLPDGVSPAVDPHDLDISTRPDPLSGHQPSSADVADITVHPMGGRKSLSVAEAASAAGGGAAAEPAEQGDASMRFREHVADQKGFARKFGHYKGQMPGGEGPSEDGSTTEDDSNREGSQMGRQADPAAQAAQDWQEQAVEAGWVPPPQRPRGSGTAPPPRATLYSLDSAMASSGGALPTVNEHPGGRRKSPEEARGSPRGLDAAAAEMAVRRGKNRFMKGGDETQAVVAGETGKPPRPAAPRQPPTAAAS